MADDKTNITSENNPEYNRRDFMKAAITVTAGLPLLTGIDNRIDNHFLNPIDGRSIGQVNTEQNLIGDYGNWFASLTKNPPALSFRNVEWKKIEQWKKQAKAKTQELLASPAQGLMSEVRVDKTYVYDGLEIEELSWQLPYGRRTEAVLLKPQGASKPLPGILALHDHAGKKYFGYSKLVKTSDNQHPLIVKHQAGVYSGRAWANEIAKRGYVVLVHDTFAFGSRRVFYDDVGGLDYGALNTKDKTDHDPEQNEHILAYNEWSKAHEHVMSKSLFCAGTTWPGVTLAEDQTALSVLSARAEVDPKRMGCAGLSGGGLRTVYLGGLDERIKCAVCVGFMTTWNDLLLNKSVNQTWMTFTPLLPNYLDFPEILGLRVPLPTLVQNNNQDGLFTLSEMKKADLILKAVFEKAGAAEKYQARFYEGPHKFDQQMQEEAFDWFDQWI